VPIIKSVLNQWLAFSKKWLTPQNVKFSDKPIQAAQPDEKIMKPHMMRERPRTRSAIFDVANGRTKHVERWLQLQSVGVRRRASVIPA
jgi:hypothetical protein